MRLLISLLLVALLLVPSATVVAISPSALRTSQTSSPQTARVAKLKAEVQKRGIGEKARVRVTLHDKSQQKGYITGVEDTSFSITDKTTGQANNISYADVDRIQGGGLSRGAKIGIAVGVGVVVAAVVIAIVASRAHGPGSFGL